MKTFVALVVTAAAAAGGIFWYQQNGRSPPVEYRTATIRRGEVHAVISATGTVEPEEVVDVGAQVAGRIESLGRDPQDPSRSIDYRSPVEEGTILAQIDDDVYRSQVDQAKAAVQRAEADVLQQRAKLKQFEREWNRVRELHKRKSVSDANLDLAEANYEAASAMVAVTDAALEQAKASLQQAEINLGYTTIKSPVKGVIVDRRVNVGQTVVASLNAPSLFLIAKDLTRLQVWASVNEADIGQIYTGQKVHFTVDAHPNETFEGTVAQIRLNATMTQNVVTYTVVVSTDNSSGRLLPYLTANLQFEIASREDVLVVPSVALRWQPQRDGPGSSEASTRPKSKEGKEGAEKRKSDPGTGQVWVRDGESLRPIDVSVGLTDGVVTEISGAGIDDGVEVVTGEVRTEAVGPTSPFAPQRSRGAGGAGGAGGGRGQ